MLKFLFLAFVVTFVSVHANGVSDGSFNVGVLNTNVEGNDILNNIFARTFHYRTLHGYGPNYRGIIPDLSSIKDTVGNVLPVGRTYKYRTFANKYNNYGYRNAIPVVNEVPEVVENLSNAVNDLPIGTNGVKGRTFTKKYDSYGY